MTTKLSEVLRKRDSAIGCCGRYADNMACDCVERAMEEDGRGDDYEPETAKTGRSWFPIASLAWVRSGNSATENGRKI